MYVNLVIENIKISDLLSKYDIEIPEFQRIKNNTKINNIITYQENMFLHLCTFKTPTF